jgi:deoxyribodipyrimidine photo-lyase
LDKKYKKSLFIFRRDLRLHDNTALIEALKSSVKVIACFIFDPRQVGKNPYRSNNAIQFMIESLIDLDQELRTRKSRLYFFQGIAENMVEKLVKSEAINAVFVNRDYTPFSRKRDNQLETMAKKRKIDFNSYSDLLLTEVGTLMTGKGTPYTVYSHFANKAASIPVKEPKKNIFRNFFAKKIKWEDANAIKEVLPKTELNDEIFIAGGRNKALKLLKQIRAFSNYDHERNLPEKEATTGLSAHNKFGTVSIREVYHTIAASLGPSHSLIRELYWRDFFAHVAFYFPHVFGHSFHKKYDHLNWDNNRIKFKAWRCGKTGFPIVDAGMRQLNVSGFMHNRVRMITASFLVKDLHIDWQWGEKYFAKTLIDYDPSVNNGNWQWAASTGCDAQPYFRIFNPWIQQKKFDPECAYIKKWVPELRAYDTRQIHALQKGNSLKGYQLAIVKHTEAKHAAQSMFIEATEKAAT